MSKKLTPKITQEKDKEVPVEILAQSIVSISAGIKKLLDGPLNEKCLVLLIQAASPTVSNYPKRKVTAQEIKAVIQGIKDLEKQFLK